MDANKKHETEISNKINRNHLELAKPPIFFILQPKVEGIKKVIFQIPDKQTFKIDKRFFSPE